MHWPKPQVRGFDYCPPCHHNIKVEAAHEKRGGEGRRPRLAPRIQVHCTFTSHIPQMTSAVSWMKSLGSFKVSIMYTIICPIRYLIIRSGVQ